MDSMEVYLMGRESKIRRLRKLKVIPEVKQRGERRQMSRGWKIVIWSVVAVAFVLIVLGIWAYSGRNIEARVGSQVVTDLDLETRAYLSIQSKAPPEQLQQQTQDEFYQMLESEKESMLSRIIQEKVYIEAARREGKEVSEEQLKATAQQKIDEEIKLQVVQKPLDQWTDADTATWNDWLVQQGFAEGEEASESTLLEFLIDSDNFKDEIEFRTCRQVIIGDQLDDMTVTDDEAKDWYNQVGSLRLSHILLRYDSLAQPAEKAKELSEKLAGIRDQILAGEITFADAANQNSDDAGVGENKNGGDLGWYTIQGNTLVGDSGATLVQEFNDAAIKLNLGEISGIVTTQYGFHIIECTEVENNSTNYDLNAGVRLAVISMPVVDPTNTEASPASVEEWTAKENEAKDIIAQIRSGKLSFADAASRYSTDQLTKDSGGELPSMFASDASGFFWANLEDAKKYEGQGAYPFEPTVVETAMGLSNGAVAPAPVRTGSGWVIVKKIAARDAKKMSFDEVAEQVKSDLLVQKKNDFESDWLNTKRGEINVSIGNPWKTFANWWDNSVVAPLGDFGDWITGALGKKNSQSGNSGSTTTIPVDDSGAPQIDMNDPEVQKMLQDLQNQGGQGTTPTP